MPELKKSEHLLFFVHGLFGSHIHTEQECIFPPSLLQLVGFKSTRRLATVEPKDTAPKIISSFLGKSIYKKFCNKFQPVCLTYDWRRPETAPKRLMKQLKQKLHANVKTCAFVCHSLGGIIVHNLLTNEKYQGDVEWVKKELRPKTSLVVMVGSPILGLSLYYDLLRKNTAPRDFRMAKINIISNETLNLLLQGREEQYIEFFCQNISTPIDYNCLLINNRSIKTPITVQQWQKKCNDVMFKDFQQAKKFNFNGNNFVFSTKTVPFVFGDGVVPIIPPEYQFFNKERVMILEINTKKSHSCLLNSSKVHLLIEHSLSILQTLQLTGNSQDTSLHSLIIARLSKIMSILNIV